MRKYGFESCVVIYKLIVRKLILLLKYANFGLYLHQEYAKCPLDFADAVLTYLLIRRVLACYRTAYSLTSNIYNLVYLLDKRVKKLFERVCSDLYLGFD